MRRIMTVGLSLPLGLSVAGGAGAAGKKAAIGGYCLRWRSQAEPHAPAPAAVSTAPPL